MYGPPGANNCRAELTFYAYNEEDEEAANTTSTDVESRDDGDCGDEQDCIHLKLSGYMFADTESTYGDGEWTMKIRNDRVNDFNIDQFVIRLYYKWGTSMRRTRIVATIDPACDDYETLKSLLEAGVDVCRFNYSHGEPEDKTELYHRLRSIEDELGRPTLHSCRPSRAQTSAGQFP